MPNILAFKSCTSYMVNLKTMFANTFFEKGPLVVFRKFCQGRILVEACDTNL